MIALENVAIALATPLAISLFFLRGAARRFAAAFLLGFVACTVAAFINGYIVAVAADAGLASMTAAESSIRLTPIVEEVMKGLPVFFYVAVFVPKAQDVVSVAVSIALGFATLESVGYLMQFGADDVAFTAVRGLSAGLTHAVAGAILGFGLAQLYRNPRLAVTGCMGLICATTSFHALYNVLVGASGGWRAAGYAMPMVSALILVAIIGLRSPKTPAASAGQPFEA